MPRPRSARTNTASPPRQSTKRWLGSDCPRLGQTYRISKLAPGEYRLRFAGNAAVTEYSQDQSSEASSQLVVVGAGTTTVDAELARRPQISGTIRDATTGLPISRAFVLVTTQSGQYVTTTNTDPTGRYSVVVTEGTYLVQSNGVGSSQRGALLPGLGHDGGGHADHRRPRCRRVGYRPVTADGTHDLRSRDDHKWLPDRECDHLRL